MQERVIPASSDPAVFTTPRFVSVVLPINTWTAVDATSVSCNDIRVFNFSGQNLDIRRWDGTGTLPNTNTILTIPTGQIVSFGGFFNAGQLFLRCAALVTVVCELTLDAKL